MREAECYGLVKERRVRWGRGKACGVPSRLSLSPQGMVSVVYV